MAREIRSGWRTRGRRRRVYGVVCAIGHLSFGVFMATADRHPPPILPYPFLHLPALGLKIGPHLSPRLPATSRGLVTMATPRALSSLFSDTWRMSARCTSLPFCNTFVAQRSLMRATCMNVHVCMCTCIFILFIFL